RARRRLAGCGSRRRGRRPGRELERRDLPDPARLDRAARGRARARGAPPARSDAKLSMAAGRQRDGMAGTPEPDAVDVPVAEETDSASAIRRRGATGAALLTVRAAA